MPILYGPVARNSESGINGLVDRVWAAQDAGAGVRMDDWAVGSPTNTEDVARVCVDVVARYARNGGGEEELPRVLQFSAQERMTKYAVCVVLAEILGLPLKGMVAVRDGGRVGEGSVERPFDCGMSVDALEGLGISVYTQDFLGWW